MKKILGNKIREHRRSRSLDKENLEQNVIPQEESIKPVVEAAPVVPGPIEAAEPAAPEPVAERKPDARDKTISKLEKEIRVLKREIKGAKTEYEANATSISELKLENERLEQEKTALEAENLALFLQVEQLKAELAARAEQDEAAKKTQKEEAIRASQTFSASKPQRETGYLGCCGVGTTRSRSGSLSAKKGRRPSSQVIGLPPVCSGIF